MKAISNAPHPPNRLRVILSGLETLKYNNMKTAKEYWRERFGEYPQTDSEKLAVVMMLEYSQEVVKNLAIHDVVCSYSPFPQSLKAGKKYRILAKHKDSVAIIDDTKELVIYNKCYFDLP